MIGLVIPQAALVLKELATVGALVLDSTLNPQIEMVEEACLGRHVPTMLL